MKEFLSAREIREVLRVGEIEEGETEGEIRIELESLFSCACLIYDILCIYDIRYAQENDLARKPNFPSPDSIKTIALVQIRTCQVWTPLD